MPTNVSSIWTGLYTVQLSWSAPVNNTPTIAGYEVFFAESGSNITESGGNTTTTTISLTLPTLNETYDLFVVAYSDEDNTLPSARSNIAIDYSSEFLY